MTTLATLTTERDQIAAIAATAQAYVRELDRQIAGRKPDDEWEWYEFFKALHDYWAGDSIEAALDAACHELNIDREGDAMRDDSEADYRYELAREDRI